MTDQGMTKRSYLTVFAALVLAVALAVPAIGAGGGGDDAQKIAEKALKKAKKAQKIAKEALKQDGAPGPQGPPGQDGEDGEDGADGADGSARAFATINFGANPSGGSVDTVRSTTGTTLTHPAVGVYCVTFPGISSLTSAALASATLTASADSGATAEVLRTTPDCPDPSFEVLTKAETSGDSGFHAASNFVNFTILVP